MRLFRLQLEFGTYRSLRHESTALASSDLCLWKGFNVHDVALALLLGLVLLSVLLLLDDLVL